MKLIKLIKKNKILFLFLVLIFVYFCFYNNDIEHFTIEKDTTIEKRNKEFNKLMENFEEIFPDGNRNAGGVQFFHYIVNMNLNKNDFELYNSFYCGVSGSPIDPNRKNNYDYAIVKDLEDNDIYGKYYLCCSPCLCDIMKYARVDKYDTSFDNKPVTYDVLTIKDPCCNQDNIPNSVTSFKCQNNQTQNGIFSRNGRLIFALFYEAKRATPIEHMKVKKSVDNCQDRMNTEPENLKYGMGNIFVNLSLNCDNLEGFTGEKKFHPTLKNIYGEPLQPCKTSESPGSWDNNGYCSEKGGGVHQICMSVTDDTKNFSKQTGQSDWSNDRVDNNHCMCLGAWALYKAKNLGNNNELVCESIPEMSLNKDYVSNWNTWNGYELDDQIIKGVDSKVKQCYDKKNSQHLKNKYDKLRNHYVTKYDQEWNSII